MVPITNFTKGEISPELYARIDTDQYGAAAKKVRNFIIQRYGGLAFRPGFRLVGEVDVGAVATSHRYIPFQFNIEQSYVMVYDNLGMRFLANGGMVVEADYQITAITKAASAQITIAFHALNVGDRIYLSDIVGMTEMNGKHVVVASVIDANNFTVSHNTTAYTTFVSSTGLVRVAAPVPPPPPPPPPTPPPPPPPPPETTDSGGSGGDYGGLEGFSGFNIP